MNSGVFVRATQPARPSSTPSSSSPTQLRVVRRGRPQHQPLALEEVDEAGVAAGGVGGDVDDPAQHPVEVERRRDRLDHRVEGLVLAPRATRASRVPDELQTQTRPPSPRRASRGAILLRRPTYARSYIRRAEVCGRCLLPRPACLADTLAAASGLPDRPGRGPQGSRVRRGSGPRQHHPRRAVLLLHRRADVADPRRLHDVRDRRRPPQERARDGDEEHPHDRRRHAELLLLRLVDLQLQHAGHCRSARTAPTSPRLRARAGSRGPTSSGPT